MATPAAEFDHETIAFADGGQQGEHSRCARVCMETKPQVVHMGKIGPIVRIISLAHADSPLRAYKKRGAVRRPLKKSGPRGPNPEPRDKRHASEREPEPDLSDSLFGVLEVTRELGRLHERAVR